MIVLHAVNGELHSGPEEGCTKCAKWATSLVAVSKKNGRSGGKRSISSNKRKCACGNPLSNANKSGLCKKCFQAAAQKAKKRKPRPKAKKKFCIVCGKKVNPKNRSGYCLKHYNTSSEWKARLVEHGSWISAACMGKDVKDRPDLKANG